MGESDFITRASIKVDDQGNHIFYPWGTIGKGRVIHSEDLRKRIVRFLRAYYLLTFSSTFAFGVIINWDISVVIFLVSLIWYSFSVSRLTKGLPYTDRNFKNNINDNITRASQDFNLFFILFCFLASIVFVSASLIILFFNRDEFITGIMGLIFFTPCCYFCWRVAKEKYDSM